MREEFQLKQQIHTAALRTHPNDSDNRHGKHRSKPINGKNGLNNSLLFQPHHGHHNFQDGKNGEKDVV